MKDSDYKDLLNEMARNNPEIHQMTENEADQLKKCLIEMACDIDKRCRKNGISIFLVGGSLLGAVRHKGFIPWDDDLDFGLKRKDYSKLISIFDKEFGDSYTLRCPNSDHPNGNRFMQIYKNNTYLKNAFERNSLQPDCVSIDIFPYDYVPENKIQRLVKGMHANLSMLIASCVFSFEYSDNYLNSLMKKSNHGRKIYYFRRIVGKVFSFQSAIKWFDKVDNCINYSKKTNFITSATGRKHYFKEIYPIDIFFPLTELKFENHSFFAPRNYHEYLKGNYGSDYMTPPPYNTRESHFIIKIKV